MRLGIVGLPQSGKSTVFEALTGNLQHSGNRGEDRIGTITVPDERVSVLSGMYHPRKTIYAQVEYFLPGRQVKPADQGEAMNWTAVRDCDALIHVVRHFGGYGFEPPTPAEDFSALNQDLIISDQVVVEKRLDRLEQEKKRGKSISEEEHGLLRQCLERLENEVPLRKCPELVAAPALRGFALLSAKPMLVLFNNEDDDDGLPTLPALADEECMVIRGKLEQELGQMDEVEAGEFLAEFNITASATDRVIKQSYALLGLISFFTVGEDEVRAWTIRKGIPAVEAAGVIHSDMQKGFIRAEVVAYDDLISAGSMAETRKQGTFRLEGKTYIVADGDIISFRFNV